jgi:hypothetical protein
MRREIMSQKKLGCEVSALAWRAFALLIGSALLVSGNPSMAQPAFESPPRFSASKILPANLLSGPNHRVDERVTNDGFMNHYLINSRFGPFKANSNGELRIRVSEINAIARLEEVSRSEQFAKGVGKAGRDVLEVTAGAFTDPKETLEDTAGGVKEIFKSVGRTLSGKGGGGVRDTVGYSRAKRQYAIAFGVDPYSTNPVLQEHLSRISRAGFVGDFGATTALGLASGGAGIALSAASHMHSLQEMVRDKSPEELREINEKKLQEMGVEPSVIYLYLGNDRFSPTYQTALVAILEEMDGVADRNAFVRAAVLAKDEDQALFRVDQVRMYANYHKSVKRLRAFVPSTKLVAVAGQTADGSLVVQFPADYVALTQDLAEFVYEQALYPVAGVSDKQLWVAGGMSPAARKWFEKNGWTVRSEAHKQLLPE